MFLNISQNSSEDICAKAHFLIKLPEAYNVIKEYTLAKVFFCEFLPVTTSDILMQIVVIYKLNISLQFVMINFARWRMLQSRLNFCIDLFFGRVIFSHAMQDRF